MKSSVGALLFSRLKYNIVVDRCVPVESGIDSKIVHLVPDIMFKTGLIKSPVCIQVQWETLMGEFIGSTALKTKALAEKAWSGTLFVDEAYRLALSTQRDFGLKQWRRL